MYIKKKKKSYNTQEVTRHFFKTGAVNMHADVVGGNTEPEKKFGAELYVGTLRMHAIERGAEENRSVCVSVREGKRSCTMAYA